MLIEAESLPSINVSQGIYPIGFLRPGPINMPPDPRRSYRKSNSSNDRDIEARRSRGEISCAECRRLKLKCDRKIPCGSCVRRGCQSICPTSSLSTGQGTRFVLADTTQLHTKISDMGQRIRQLEDALAIFQSGISDECHPLLSTDLLTIKFGPEKMETPPKAETLSSSLDALGTLTIGEDGEARYFGRSAGSETLLLAGAEDEPLEFSDAPPSIRDDLAKLSNSFPFGEISLDLDNFLPLISSYFPERLRAWSICELYTEQFAWSFSPILRDEIIDDYLTPVYKALNTLASGEPQIPSNLTPHKCAVLFAVFAIGSWVDLTVQDYAFNADRFYHLSRACLSMRSVFDSPEIATVQAISLLSAYHGLDGRKFTMDSSWALVSLANKLAQSLGLHRDSARWNMDAKTVNRRRHLFWELYSNEMFYCIGLGRPPGIRNSYIDTELSQDIGALDSSGRPGIGFYRWKHEFVRSIYSDVVETMLTAIPPKYETILELDRRVREKYLPPHLNGLETPKPNKIEELSPKAFFHSTLLGLQRSVFLLHIHRSFFAKALLDHPINPLRSPYAPSFMATYRCAFAIMKTTIDVFRRFSELTYRLWHPWTHMFSAAVIFGSIVTHSPTISLAQISLTELQTACDFFENASTRMPSRRIQSATRVLLTIKTKAREAYKQGRSEIETPKELSLRGTQYGESELAIFGGHTRILVSKHISGRKSNTSSPSDSSSPQSTSSEQREMRDVHPSLVEYLGNTQGVQPLPNVMHSDATAFPSMPFPSSSTPHNWISDPITPFYAPENEAVPSWSTFDTAIFDPPVPVPDPGNLDEFMSFLSGSAAPPQPAGAINDQWQTFMSGLFTNPAPQQ